MNLDVKIDDGQILKDEFMSSPVKTNGPSISWPDYQSKILPFGARNQNDTKRINREWKEVFVSIDNNQFCYCYNDIESTKLFDEYKDTIPQEADFFEINTMTKKIVSEISVFLKRNDGICLFIDYGYLYGYGNTLQAIKNHKFVNPLRYPGFSDLTAHINFSHIIKEANNLGMNFFGTTTQRNFLIKLGALERLEMLKKSTKSEKVKFDIEEGLNRVIENSQMGELFKVCAISPKNKLIPEGFD